MTLEESRGKFVQAWGTLASSWGINKTMAQVHALLLVSTKPMSAEEIMEALDISRGNSNMNIRSLIEWGLVHKELRAGERKEYFVAEKDMWEIIRQIIIHRKKKELEPVLKVLSDLDDIEGDSPEVEDFKKVVRDIRLFSNKADSALDGLIKADSGWLIGTFINLIK